MKIKLPKVIIELKPSKITPRGVGVFAVTLIKKGAKIAVGPRVKDFRHVTSQKEFNKYSKDIRRKILDFCIGTPHGFLISEGLDFNELPASWYMNHSCNGNVGFDKNGDFVARRNIKKGEELSYDYGLLESNPKFIIKKCTCGSKNCRKTITGNNWKDKEFRKKNLRYIHPFSRKLK